MCRFTPGAHTPGTCSGFSGKPTHWSISGLGSSSADAAHVSERWDGQKVGFTLPASTYGASIASCTGARASPTYLDESVSLRIATSASTSRLGMSPASSPTYSASPRQSCPAPFAPQHTTVTSGSSASSTASAAHACARPADTCTAPRCGSDTKSTPSTECSTGKWLFWPSWPNSLLPQHSTLPPPCRMFSAGEMCSVGLNEGDEGPESAHEKDAPTETEYTRGALAPPSSMYGSASPISPGWSPIAEQPSAPPLAAHAPLAAGWGRLPHALSPKHMSM
mmetsp:Transcript_14817/g.38564  ORF Transcript_14817/g.38564 Transcript_14817/m.38564 type:complete len:279 (-) Transcript_14817:628-1464(-)